MTHGVHKTYEVGLLSQNEALHLFCLKAFKADQPQEGYLDLSKEVVDYTGCLPLALEVLGSYLYGRNVDLWHSAVKKIRSAPLREIQDKLEISYESLDAMEKAIFLDIACFFKGMETDKIGLWSQEDIDLVLTTNMGTGKISSIVLNFLRPYEACWRTDAFSKTSQLKLLILNEFMKKLKYLNLKFSKNLKRLPDFSGVPNLEKLILKGCEGLTE
ncbi:TMV resistance protein N, partial [Trifolium medium]|nr:TMV resistance protein N [Trifolium medium]